EKLFEELLRAEEGIIATEHEKIWKAQLSFMEEADLFQGLEKLKYAIDHGEHEEIRPLLKTLVPSYTPLGVNQLGVNQVYPKLG
ncbi:MAG: hypothetical protein HYU05_01950, partial [Candidatus Wildermuthbacteria bacterium]|nr:hypothetical protein [Candidatus Wildermuthbacteria bacterium]